MVLLVEVSDSLGTTHKSPECTVFTGNVSFPRGILTVPMRSSKPLVWFQMRESAVEHTGINPEEGLLAHKGIGSGFPDIGRQRTAIAQFSILRRCHYAATATGANISGGGDQGDHRIQQGADADFGATGSHVHRDE